MEPSEAGQDRDAWREIRPRIGERRSVGLPARWRPPQDEVSTKRRRRRRQAAPEPAAAIAHDLSISGARLLLPADARMARNGLFELEIGGEWTTAQVTWLDPAPDPAAVWCGAQFLNPGRSFLLAVSRAMEVDRLTPDT